MGKTARKVKRGVRRLLWIWRAITVILLSALLIPLFLANKENGTFYTWWVPISILIYLILTYVHLRLGKGFVKEHLEAMATRLLLGLVALAAAFILTMVTQQVAASVFLVMAGLLYAMAIQRVAFLRLIGL